LSIVNIAFLFNESLVELDYMDYPSQGMPRDSWVLIKLLTDYSLTMSSHQ